MAEPGTVAVTLAVGLATGTLSGMFGVGGAVISTPAVRVLGASPIQAVGTTLPSILPSALVGSLRYRREGLIDGRLVAWASGAGIAAAVGASLLAEKVPGRGHLLMVATAVLIGYTASRLVPPGPPGEPADPAAVVDTDDAVLRDEWWRLALSGVAAGVMSGLLGLGGGVILMPAFLRWVGLPVKRAIGTSLACVGILAVPSTVTHAVLGHIDWSFAVPLSIAVIPGARVGAGLAIRTSDRGLRIAVAALLAAIAVVYGTRELAFLA